MFLATRIWVCSFLFSLSPSIPSTFPSSFPPSFPYFLLLFFFFLQDKVLLYNFGPGLTETHLSRLPSTGTELENNKNILVTQHTFPWGRGWNCGCLSVYVFATQRPSSKYRGSVLQPLRAWVHQACFASFHCVSFLPWWNRLISFSWRCALPKPSPATLRESLITSPSLLIPAKECSAGLLLLAHSFGRAEPSYYVLCFSLPRW